MYQDFKCVRVHVIVAHHIGAIQLVCDDITHMHEQHV